MRMEEVIINAILQIGNSKEFIKSVEPQVCFPGTLQAWQVRRVIRAQELLEEEYRKGEKNE